MNNLYTNQSSTHRRTLMNCNIFGWTYPFNLLMFSFSSQQIFTLSFSSRGILTDGTVFFCTLSLSLSFSLHRPAGCVESAEAWHLLKCAVLSSLLHTWSAITAGLFQLHVFLAAGLKLLSCYKYHAFNTLWTTTTFLSTITPISAMINTLSPRPVRSLTWLTQCHSPLALNYFFFFYLRHSQHFLLNRE